MTYFLIALPIGAALVTAWFCAVTRLNEVGPVPKPRDEYEAAA